MAKKRAPGGRPRDIDRERFQSGQVRPLDGPVASPLAVAKRAILADPKLAKNAVAKAKAEWKERREADPKLPPFSFEQAAEAAASTAPLADVLSKAEALDRDMARRSETAFGRYFLWARFRPGAKQYGLEEREYLAGVEYADRYGIWRVGMPAELREAAERTDGLSSAGVIAPPRRIRSNIGSQVKMEPAADLDPKPQLSAEEKAESRKRAWLQLKEATDRLATFGPLVARMVNSLVIEDREPWWMSPAPVSKKSDRESTAEYIARRREAATKRAAQAWRERRQVKEALADLATLFGFKKREAGEPQTPPVEGQRELRRSRMPIEFYRGDTKIDAAAVAAAVKRIKLGETKCQTP